jgi:short subunit dehydrogenase-like uncharacterized protein
MIRKYESVAKASKAIIIPQCGFESAPADLAAFALVSYIREQFAVGTKEVINALVHIKGSVSGGTAASILTFADYFSLKQITEANEPWIFSPVARSDNPGPQTSLIGSRVVPDLGTLIQNITSETNRAQVHRSWGLIGSSVYGSKFRYYEYLKVRNPVQGFLLRVAFNVGLLLLLIAPFRKFMERYVYPPGSGPPLDQEFGFVYKGIGIADDDKGSQNKRALTTLKYDGNIYDFTAVLMVDAALSLLYDDTLAGKSGGGFVTPAMLGKPYLERLDRAGLKITTKTIS